MNRDEIYRTIRGEVETSAAGTRLTPIRKLMTRFETGQRTVESVLEQLIAENLLYRRPGDGYFVRDLSESRKLRLLMLLPKWASENLVKVERAFMQLGEEEKFTAISRTLESSASFTENLPYEGCDALVILPPAGLIDMKLICGLASLTIPVAVFDNEIGNAGFSLVTQDGYAGGMTAASHFIRNGHRKLAIIVTEPHNATTDMRVRGFCDFAAFFGAETEIIDIERGSWQSWDMKVYEALNARLDRRAPDFTGLFLLSGWSALEVYKVCAERNLSIPGDLSIIGYDMLVNHALMHPPLTAVEFDVVAAIRLLIRRLLEQMTTQGEPFQLRLKPKLTERGSVRNLNL